MLVPWRTTASNFVTLLTLTTLVDGCSLPKLETDPYYESNGIGGSPIATTVTNSVPSANGGTTSIGSTTLSEPYEATGGRQSTGGTSSTGGTRNSGGVSSTGGTRNTGGTSTTTLLACTASTNLLSYRSTDADANWIGNDPASVLDNPCGIQGAIYAYSDDLPSASSPSPINRSPCSTGRCCISGVTTLWTEMVGGSPTYAEWGAGIGLSLNVNASQVNAKYVGPAKGFVVKTSGSLTGQEVRLLYTQVVDDDNAPFKSYLNGSGIGTLSAKFTDVTCPTWLMSCTTGGLPLDVRLQVVGGDTAGSFSLCIDSITPIL